MPVDKVNEQKNWDNYGNTPGGSRFVALDQITRNNVKDLKVCLDLPHRRYPDKPDGNGAEDQQTPLQVGDRVFLCTPHNNVIAVWMPIPVKQIWKNEINAQSQVWNRCRGLAYFDVTKPAGQPTVPGSTPATPVTLAAGDTCQRRILMNTIDARLVAINADNGEFVPELWSQRYRRSEGRSGRCQRSEISVDLCTNAGRYHRRGRRPRGR